MAESRRMNVTRRSFLLGGTAALAGAGMALSGCNHKKGGEAGSGNGEILAAIAYSSNQISPVGSTSALVVACNWHVFEGLYNIDFRTYKTYNGLAALSPTKVNDYTYDVILRDDAKFSDGTDVEAKDVVASFKANMAHESYSAFLSFIKDVTAKDKKTITFTLNFPFENLIEQRLAIVNIYPESLPADKLNSMPIGTGPWKYKSFDGNNGGKIEFEPNDNYNGKFPAEAKSMTWNVLLDNTSRTTAITDRTSYAIESVPELNAGQISSSGANVEFSQGNGSALFIFNTNKAPFNDARVRQAIFYAINKDLLIDVQLDGHATAATSYLPKNHPNYHRANTVYDYNVDKAKSLLKEAGCENLDFTLTCSTNWVRNLAPQIQNDLKDAGINCQLDIKTIPWSDYNESSGVLPFDCILNPSDVSTFGNDPDLLMSYFYGDNVWTKGRCCLRKSNPQKLDELQSLMQRARECTSSSTQQSLWNQCYDIIAELAAIYPLFHRELGTAYLSEKLANFRPISTTGLDFLGVSAKE